MAIEYRAVKLWNNSDDKIKSIRENICEFKLEFKKQILSN